MSNRRNDFRKLRKDGKDILIIGECKFKNEKIDKDVYESFIEKTRYIKGKNPLLCMFSLGGYTDYVKENDNGVLLLTIKDLYVWYRPGGQTPW